LCDVNIFILFIYENVGAVNRNSVFFFKYMFLSTFNFKCEKLKTTDMVLQRQYKLLCHGFENSGPIYRYYDVLQINTVH
jgi:hypothetical protein